MRCLQLSNLFPILNYAQNRDCKTSINMKPFHLSKRFHYYNKLNIISYLDMDKQHITPTSNLPVKCKVILQP